MPTPKPSWLSDLIKRLEYYNPAELSKLDKQKLRSMREASHLATQDALKKDLAHDVNAETMIGMALNRSIAAGQFGDTDPRLMLLPSTKSKAPRASAASVHTLGVEAGLPENSLYIESLGSTEPGAGRAVLQSLADRYPSLPIFLNSLEDPATLDFYRRRGFMQLNPLEYPELPDHLPLFALPEGRQLKADGGSVKKMGGALSKLYELLHDTRAPKEAASAFGRGLRVNGVAPAWFEQHRPELIAKALEDKHNAIVALPTKQDIDHALQLMSNSSFEDLPQWLASDDAVKAARLKEVRPWDGGDLRTAPFLAVQKGEKPGSLIGLDTHDGRHRLLSAALDEEPSALLLDPTYNDWLLGGSDETKEALQQLRGSPIRITSPFDLGAEDGMDKPFSYLFRHSFADGGSVTDPVKEYRKRNPEPKVNLKKGEALSPKDLLEKARRGFKNWVPDIFALPGDVVDLSQGAVKLAAGRAKPRDKASADLVRAVASQPDFAAGDALRALVGEQLSPGFTDAYVQHAKSDVPVDVGDVVRFANPAAWLSGEQLMSAARKPGVQGALAALAGLPGDMMAGVIKNKGGNWLSGSVEDALKGLKKAETPTREEEWLLQHAAPGTLETARAKHAPLNTWIDKQLTNYVKNQMATPEDPLRALAEQKGFSLVTPGQSNYELSTRLRAKREKAGMPPNLLASTRLGRSWEMTSDAAVRNLEARDLSAVERDSSFGGKSVDPSTVIHSMNPFASGAGVSDLGFHHLIDELSNSLNPESGLPRDLLLDLKSLPRLSVPQAVERVAKINEWRAAQKVAADAQLANNAATQVVREYPHSDTMPNPNGLKWVELNIPKGNYFGESLTKEEADSLASLEEALKYEGNTMGHCVGGYCHDVLSGNSRIFSLRDAKGEPHVTVEVTRGELPDELLDEEYGLDSYLSEYPEDVILPYAAQVKNWAEWSGMSADDILAKGEPTLQISQITGKQNKAPNPEYLPFVQDFVRNSPLNSPWSDVGDLRNTGLLDFREGISNNLRSRFGGHKTDVPGGFYTRDELMKAFTDADVPEDFARKYLGEHEGFASGGSVKTSTDLRAIINQLSAGHA